MSDQPPRYTVEGVLYSMRQAVANPPRDMTLHEWLDLLLVRLLSVVADEGLLYPGETEMVRECLKVYTQALFGEDA